LKLIEATIEASRIRLRPILMTSFTTILGILPIAIGAGTGAGRRPLGIAVVGGLLFSTFLTLLLVPTVYTLLGRFTRSRVRQESQEPQRDTVTPGPAEEPARA
jgi:multidrug efflux pump subunit AcrB